MYSNQRKNLPNQRSQPKESRSSYQQYSSNQKQQKCQHYVNYGSRKQLSKNPSQQKLNHPREQFLRNLNQRRKKQSHMSNLKSQLQNLKNQVNKLISKQSVLRTPQKEKLNPKREEFSDKKINYANPRNFAEEDVAVSDHDEQFSDTVSMTSVTTEKILNQPLRRLEKKAHTENFDQSYYQQLQNDLLKTEIKNLKNKYVSKKRQLTEKCQLLEKKNQYLEISLQKSEESLVECRKTLEMEIMLIKRQINQKNQVKNNYQPERDSFEVEGNEKLKEKVKKLYEELTEKGKQINNLHIEVGDLQAMLQRKKYDLKKQSQKNLQLSKQIEFTKRQQSRLQHQIEQELNKSKYMQKENAELKQKNKELLNEIYAKEQIVSGSEQYQSRLAEELEEYKRKEDVLLERVGQLRGQNKKLKEQVESDAEEIAYLRRSNQDTSSRIGQLSKKLKQQQQKWLERQDYYRQLIEQNKQKQEERIVILKEQYQKQTQQLNKTYHHTNQLQSNQTEQLLRMKQNQINKWKAQYKILKLKHEEKNHSEQVKRQEIDMYYKGYMKYKHQNQILSGKCSQLQQSTAKIQEKMLQKEAQWMRLEMEKQKEVDGLRLEIKYLDGKYQAARDQANQAKSQLAETVYKADQETQYRREIEEKIQKFIQKQLHPQQSDEELSQQENREIPDQNDEEQQKKKDEKDHQNNKTQNHHSPNEQKNEENKNGKREQAQQYVQEQQIKEETLQKAQQKGNQKPSQRLETRSKTQKLPQRRVQLSQSQRIQLQQLGQAISSMKKRIIQQDEKTAKNIRELKNKDSQINKLKKQVRDLLQNHQKQLTQLKQKYLAQKIQLNIKTSIQAHKETKQLYEKELELHDQKYNELLAQNLELKRKTTQSEKELLDLRQQTKSLSHLYNVKCVDMSELVERHSQEIAKFQRKVDEQQVLTRQKETNLLNEISLYKDQISTLRLQIKSLIAINKKEETSTFDEALKSQIQSNKALREELNKKTDQLYRARDNYTSLRSQFDNMRSQIQIEKLRHISQRKNLEVQYQIEHQNISNRLTVEEKKVSSLEQKIALVIEENKKKDSFIQSYIMGKKLPPAQKEFLSEFVKQYQIQLSGKHINEKLRGDSHELEKMAMYNYNLMKEMAEMKEKLLLYETMQQELSLYDSRHSEELRDNDFDSPSSKSHSPRTPNRKFKKMYSLADAEIDQENLEKSR